MKNIITVNNIKYSIDKLLGHGKGGYFSIIIWKYYYLWKLNMANKVEKRFFVFYIIWVQGGEQKWMNISKQFKECKTTLSLTLIQILQWLTLQTCPCILRGIHIDFLWIYFIWRPPFTSGDYDCLNQHFGCEMKKWR